MSLWIGVVLRLGGLALLAGTLALFGHPHAGAGLAIGGLLALLLFHVVQLTRLQYWIAHPETDLPESFGPWRRVFNALHRLRREESAGRERLAASLQRLSEAVAAVPDGIVVLDVHGRIEWCNPAAERHFQLRLQHDRLTPILHLVRDPAFVDYMAQPSAGEPGRMRAPGQLSIQLSLLLIPFAEDSKLLISRDVTAIELAERMRRDFVANVSHELRTPLTVIVGFLENLMDEGTPSREHALMYEQATRMRSLVDDLLTLSRLDAAQVPDKEETVDVPALVALVAEEARALSAGRHTLDVEAADVRLRGNGDELRSAFTNLVSNAVRYTPAGGRVLIRWMLRADAPVFEVRDTGVGIPHEHLPRLTERFYRVDKGRSSSTGGTGLGLAIVKHVLLRHQARLEIESEPEQGSVFRAVFPAERWVGARRDLLAPSLPQR